MSQIVHPYTLQKKLLSLSNCRSFKCFQVALSYFNQLYNSYNLHNSNNLHDS